MNRVDRRNKMNQAMNTANKMMQSNVTITEAVQIARGVAEDVVADYHKKQGNLQLSMTLQIEIIRDILISKGLMTEEEFKSMYMTKATELQELQNQMRAGAAGVTDMKVTAGEVEIQKQP